MTPAQPRSLASLDALRSRLQQLAWAWDVRGLEQALLAYLAALAGLPFALLVPRGLRARPAPADLEAFRAEAAAAVRSAQAAALQAHDFLKDMAGEATAERPLLALFAAELRLAAQLPVAEAARRVQAAAATLAYERSALSRLLDDLADDRGVQLGAVLAPLADAGSHALGELLVRARRLRDRAQATGAQTLARLRRLQAAHQAFSAALEAMKQAARAGG
ncbi:MAG TPA: hypothetical protein VLK85_13960 [Ramlibacter sp.]|nr:hypothetical protein [Ramlibacter sp.]